MRKKLLVVIGALTAAGVLGLGLFHPNASPNDPSLTSAQIKKLVSEQYPGEVGEPTLITESNRPVYEVKVTTDDQIYKIALGGDSGDILNIEKKSATRKDKKEKQEKQDNKEEQEKDKKSDNGDDQEEDEQTAPQEKQEQQEQQKEQEKREQQEKRQNQNNQDDTKPGQSETKTVISYEEAGQIALQEFSGKIDEIELEEEDGRQFYEVEIERGEEEAEIEIDAYTGEVIIIEIDED